MTAARVRVLQDGSGASDRRRLRSSAVDRTTQEDARRFEWNGAGPAVIGLAAEVALNLRESSALTFDFRTERIGSGAIALAMECGTRCRGAVPLRSVLAGATPGQWSRASIPLECLARSGVDLGRVTVPFELASSDAVALSVTNIGIVDQQTTSPLCPE